MVFTAKVRLGVGGRESFFIEVELDVRELCIGLKGVEHVVPISVLRNVANGNIQLITAGAYLLIEPLKAGILRGIVQCVGQAKWCLQQFYKSIAQRVCGIWCRYLKYSRCVVVEVHHKGGSLTGNGVFFKLVSPHHTLYCIRGVCYLLLNFVVLDSLCNV